MNKIIALCLLCLITSCKEKNEEKIAIPKQIAPPTKEIEKPKLSHLLKLTKVSIENYGYGTRAASVYGNGNTIYFTVTNKTGKGVKSIKLLGEYQYKGRTLTHKEEIVYNFRKGLEPGETQKVAMKPSSFSQWNKKIKPSDKGDFSLKVLSFKDYNDETIK